MQEIYGKDFIIVNTKVTLLVLALLLIFNCSKKGSNEIRLIISEPLINRVSDTVSNRHDSGCVGFYKKHFPPEILTEKYFNTDSLKILKKITGINWYPLETEDTIINFVNIFPPEDDTNRVVYVAEIVESKSDKEKILSLGSDDGFILYVNGDSVASWHTGRQVLPNDDFIRFKLRRGKNILIYKIDQGTGYWGLYRKFVSQNLIKKTAYSRVAYYFGDLPESCILPDTSKFLQLKFKNKWFYDKFFHVVIGFREMNKNGNYLSRKNFIPSRIPEWIRLPDKFKGKAIYEIEVYDVNDSLLYKEEIPIFYEKTVNYIIKNFLNHKLNIDDPVYIARYNAVMTMFDIMDDSYEVQFSTRMKAHALFDLYRYYIGLNPYTGLFSSGPRVWGYRSRIDSTVQPYRAFIPYKLPCNKYGKFNLVIIIRWALQKDINYWKTQMFRSHWRTAKRVKLSTQYQTILVVPGGRGKENYTGKSEEEIPIIIDELSSIFSIKKDNISFYANSDAPMLLISLMKRVRLPASNIGFSNPIFPDKDKYMISTLRWIKKLYPEVKWYIWQAGEDKKAPINVTVKWIDYMKKLDFDLRYFIEPHSNHDVYIGDQEKAFYEIINRRE